MRSIDTRHSALADSRIQRVAAFTALGELDFDDDGSFTEDQVQAAVEAALPFAPNAIGRPNPSRSKMRGRVLNWFQDQGYWTPFLDEVAILRAMEFDEDAIKGLSGDERAELIRRLAAMEHPWGYTTSERNSPLDPKSPREIRFDALGELGESLRDAVTRLIRKGSAA